MPSRRRGSHWMGTHASPAASLLLIGLATGRSTNKTSNRACRIWKEDHGGSLKGSPGTWRRVSMGRFSKSYSVCHQYVLETVPPASLALSAWLRATPAEDVTPAIRMPREAAQIKSYGSSVLFFANARGK
jgi:hypothetical protein